jgi:hypothetical protein
MVDVGLAEQTPSRHVFVSYAREDRDIAKLLADDLARNGLTVWRDTEIRPGRDFNSEIDAALDTAACVIVIWSAHSVGSTWVRAEATVGLERDILVPVSIDDSKPSTIFRIMQTIPLDASVSGLRNDGLASIRRSVAAVIGPTPIPPPVTSNALSESLDVEDVSPVAENQNNLSDGTAVLWHPTSERPGLARLRVSVDRLERGDHSTSRLGRLVVTLRNTETAQRGFVDVSMRMISDLLDLDALDESGRAIFELLIPRDLKSSVASANSLEIGLDSLAAVLPWEAMATVEGPLALAVPLTRRLISVRSQPELPSRSSSAHVLLLGNVGPKVGFPPMAGAFAEATRLEDIFGNHGLTVRAIIDDASARDSDWRRIVRALYAQPYDIMHVASLSTIWRESGNSGLPIGQWGADSQDLVLLTGSMIGQLSNPPRLAMFNDGHDARVLPPDVESVEDTTLRDSLVYQLLSGGTEVFVGPIGPVNDEEATAVATEFYERLLEGQTAGTAMLEARRRAVSNRPGSSLYATYHCYGSVDWVL